MSRAQVGLPVRQSISAVRPTRPPAASTVFAAPPTNENLQRTVHWPLQHRHPVDRFRLRPLDVDMRGTGDGAVASCNAPNFTVVHATCSYESACEQWLVLNLSDGTQQWQYIGNTGQTLQSRVKKIDISAPFPPVSGAAWSSCFGSPVAPSAIANVQQGPGHISFSSEDAFDDDYNDLVCDLNWQL